MQIWIPSIKDRLLLTQDWTFGLHLEARNTGFAAKNIPEYEEVRAEYREARYAVQAENRILREQGLPRKDEPSKPVFDFTLPAGTILVVDRIYIRTGAKDFDSLTFRSNAHLKGKLAKGKIKGRFWAKLTDVNQMHIQQVIEG